MKRLRYPFSFRIRKHPHSIEAPFDENNPNEVNIALFDELRTLNKNMSEFNRSHRLSFRFLMGIATGLGTVLGATVVVSLLIYLLRPIASIEWLKPIVDEVVKLIETRTKSGYEHQH